MSVLVVEKPGKGTLTGAGTKMFASAEVMFYKNKALFIHVPAPVSVPLPGFSTSAHDKAGYVGLQRDAAQPSTAV